MDQHDDHRKVVLYFNCNNSNMVKIKGDDDPTPGIIGNAFGRWTLSKPIEVDENGVLDVVDLIKSSSLLSRDPDLDTKATKIASLLDILSDGAWKYLIHVYSIPPEFIILIRMAKQFYLDVNSESIECDIDCDCMSHVDSDIGNWGFPCLYIGI
jgi:hypothetical protein